MTTTDTATGRTESADAASSSARTTTIEQDPAAASPGRTRSTEELKALVADAQQRFGERDADPDEVLAWAAKTFGKKLAVAWVLTRLSLAASTTS